MLPLISGEVEPDGGGEEPEEPVGPETLTGNEASGESEACSSALVTALVTSSTLVEEELLLTGHQQLPDQRHKQLISCLHVPTRCGQPLGGADTVTSTNTEAPPAAPEAAAPPAINKHQPLV